MTVGELTQLRSWLGTPPRHPQQTHGVYESDAEVVRLGDGSYLVASVDALEQEISLGLYREPYTIGWVAAVNGLSDIAAVGAEPIGVLLSAVWGPDMTAGRRAGVAGGFTDALAEAGTFLLGGDTGDAEATVLSATAIGRTDAPPVRRIGARAGDVLCLTGEVGPGAAMAGAYLLEADDAFPEEWYRPMARLREGAALRPHASAGTDVSDGLLSAIWMLSSQNGLGAALRWVPDLVEPRAATFFRDRGLPLWLTWFSELSDYELLLTVPEAEWPAAKAAVPELTEIGRMTDEPEFTLAVDDRTIPIDLSDVGRFTRAEHSERAGMLADLLTEITTLGLP